ncbi:tRNA 2'-phosphotransferase 1 [Seminavis robusta]|uniref:2'-phosphotransferase n=1 Tax=Seminavis robusta TaxID=568900 RepID=A0A9N8ESH8_9STRA|nr:tRNA 2'-phosphotransferase 1 [Seminavis robusta]|eukprot:Sro1553_g281970.1 tRNA 2'-phosphotransferase 1 (264) ;mRNA; f:24243-25034
MKKGNNNNQQQQPRKEGQGNPNNRKKKRPPPTRAEKTSKTLAWALRHQGPEIGLPMTPDGFVPVSEILNCRHEKLRHQEFTFEDIQEIVRSCAKQRFHMEWKPISNYPDVDTSTFRAETINHDDNTILCIRASQGHSLPFIDPELLLTPVPPEELAHIPIIVHGTYKLAWETAICTKGLNKMTRNNIHFAPGLPRNQGVISGMRATCGIYIYVNAAKCANHPGIVFYKSANGVLLTAGIDGTLPVEYFSHVTDAKGKVLLDQR